MNIIDTTFLVISLFFFSLGSYLVYLYYDNNISISSIYCNNEVCRKKSLKFTLLMGLFAMFYELTINDKIAMFIVLLKYIGLYGLIYTDTKYKIHYVFTFLAFISMTLFMIYYNYKISNNILKISLFIQLLLLEKIIIDIRGGKIFFNEIYYSLNYVLFYIYIHCFRT